MQYSFAIYISSSGYCVERCMNLVNAFHSEYEDAQNINFCKYYHYSSAIYHGNDRKT